MCGVMLTFAISCENGPSVTAAPCPFKYESEIRENPATQRESVFFNFTIPFGSCDRLQGKCSDCGAVAVNDPCDEVEEFEFCVSTIPSGGGRVWEVMVTAGPLANYTQTVSTLSEAADELAYIFEENGVSACNQLDSWRAQVIEWLQSNWMDAGDFHSTYGL